MPDPLDALRLGSTPEPPRPEFAEALKARIAAAFGVRPDDPTTTPRSTAMSDVTTAQKQIVMPYLTVHDGAAALTWYQEALGAFEQMRVVGDDGRLGHAEFVIGGARFMLSDEYPEMGVLSPQTLGGSTAAMYLEVVDVDHAYRQAVDASATTERPPEDQAHGNRTASIRDPFGHRWMLSQPIEALSTEEYAARETGGFTVQATTAPVEPGYLTFATGDVARASSFFGELFGWSVERGHSGEGYGHVANTRFPMGFAPVGDDVPVTVYFRVDDIERYASRIEELGGRILSRNQYASGGNASCVDDQGFHFELQQPAPGY